MTDDAGELLGPYERWAYGVGARYALSGAAIAASPFLAAVAELPAGGDPRALDRVTGRSSKSAAAAVDDTPIRLPTLWRHAFEGSERTFCPLVLNVANPHLQHPSNRLRGLADGLRAVGDAQRRATHARVRADDIGFRVNLPIAPAAMNAGFRPDAIDERYARCGERGRPAAVMAVIDDGIPFAHMNFRDSQNRARLEFCWLQGAQADSNTIRQTVLFGREHTREDIDGLIRAFDRDEDALYRATSSERGLYPGGTISRFATHGSHVLDMAAGHRHGSGRDPLRPLGPEGDLDALAIIAVQLPATATIETASFGKDAFILSAFHYIFDRADRIAGKHLGEGAQLPLIINFSYGFSGGPHNGEDRLERALRNLVRRRTERGGATHLVMPAGNDFLTPLYGAITPRLARGDKGTEPDSFDIPWRLQPNDRTSSYLEIWLPRGASPKGLAIEVWDPHGARLHGEEVRLDDPPMRHADIAQPGRADGPAIGQLTLERYRISDSQATWRFVLALAPTEPDDPSLPAARCGRWMIRLKHLRRILAHGGIACRIQRDTNPFGYARGARQSYLDDPADAPFELTGRRPRGDNPDGVLVRRFGTLNGLATHDAVTVVGGYVATTLQPAHYSAAGASDAASFAQGSVHVSAPSESSPVLAGVRSAGTRSGSVTLMTGTSAAAPQVARALAVAHLSGLAGIAPARRDGAPEAAAILLDRWLHSPPADAVMKVRLGAGLIGPATDVADHPRKRHDQPEATPVQPRPRRGTEATMRPLTP